MPNSSALLGWNRFGMAVSNRVLLLRVASGKQWRSALSAEAPPVYFSFFFFLLPTTDTEALRRIDAWKPGIIIQRLCTTCLII